ncbi:divalent-cation tolerance protein CutA [Candidatus Aquarickettsia rohweri]|uniref:Divalent-cation tolerance protein CutA n=1 Tax=Candidatus Aquarickettsia rohweri TaxID=2602574 RepID=A0A3R9XRS7_9RICK|nr:divalent-cation tolerance protein CutA [Candidatus Aquarickettsia rohweri]RST68095.1 divalent-cation tolerance protein CutA [Candidatus Aquarickettsia rohweri]
MHNFSLIYVTCKNKNEANSIATILVEEKLVACANIINSVKSIYYYNNQIHYDNEVILILKTQSKLFDEVRLRILKIHSYESPCIVEIKISNGEKSFLDWIISSTSI